MVNKQSEKYEIFWSLQMNWNRKFIYKWTGIWISLLSRMNLILLKYYNYHEWTEILWILLLSGMNWNVIEIWLPWMNGNTTEI